MGQTLTKAIPYVFLVIALISLYLQIETWRSTRKKCTCGEDVYDELEDELGRINP